MEQCSLEVLALGLLMVDLLHHQPLGEKSLAMVEQGLGVLVHELQAQLALGHLTLVPSPPDSLQNCPLGDSKVYQVHTFTNLGLPGLV